MFASLKSNILIAAGLAGTLFIGCSMYIDWKLVDSNTKKSNPAKLSRSERERIFLHEVNQAKVSLCNNSVKKGVRHFTNSILVCDDPKDILPIFYDSLPPNTFYMIIERLSRILSARNANANSGKVGFDDEIENGHELESSGMEMVNSDKSCSQDMENYAKYYDQMVGEVEPDLIFYETEEAHDGIYDASYVAEEEPTREPFTSLAEVLFACTDLD